MSLEDQVRTHEEWLHSIDSNLDRLAAGLAAVDQRLEATNQALAVVAQNQANFSAIQVRQERQVQELRDQMKELAVQHQKLEQAFEQYLRSRTNGRQN